LHSSCKVDGPQVTKKFAVFFMELGGLLPCLKSLCHCILSWARWIQSISSQPIS